MTEGFPSVWGWWRLSLRRGFSSARQLFLTALIAGLLVVALGVPVVLASNAVSAQQAGAGSQLNALKVDVPVSTEGGITREVLDWMAKLPGVAGAVIDLEVAVYGDGEETWDANTQVLRPWLLPPGISIQQLAGNQVIIPDKIDGAAMDSYVGKALPISYVRAIGQSTGEQESGSVQVVATYPANWSGYGQEVVLASEELVIRLHAARYAQNPSVLLERTGVDGAWVQVDGDESLERVASDIRAKGFDVTAERDRLGALPGLLAAFPVFLAVVGAGMLLLLLGRILSSVKMSLGQRTREFGLLRMRGYAVSDIRKLVVLEGISGVFVGAFAGTAVGLGAGIWLSTTLIPKELEAPGGWEAVVASLPLAGLTVLSVSAFALVAGLLAVRRIMRHDPFLLIMREC